MPEAAAVVVAVEVMLAQAGSLVTKHQMAKTVKQEILIIPPTMVMQQIIPMFQVMMVLMVIQVKRDKLDKMVHLGMLLQ